MKIGDKRISPALFAFALVLFLMPFLSVSCEGRSVATLTGIDLLFGSTIKTPQLMGPSHTEHTPVEGWAVIAFLAFAGGLFLGIRRPPYAVKGMLACGGAAFVALLLLKAKLGGDLPAEAQGLVRVDGEFAFWLALLTAAAAAALNGYELAGGATPAPNLEEPRKGDQAAGLGSS